MPMLTDAELEQLMKQLAKVANVPLADERLDRDLVAFKAFITANDKIRAVPLPFEAEPFVTLKKQ